MLLIETRAYNWIYIFSRVHCEASHILRLKGLQGKVA